MSIFIDNTVHQYVGCSAGTLGAVGTGSYTIVSLHRPSSTAAGVVSLWSGSITGTMERELIGDTSSSVTHWFGASDFTGGFGDATHYAINTWYLVGESKAAGSNYYRWHVWPYAADGSGTKDHGDNTTGATHPDGAAIAAVRLGDGDNRGAGEIALVAIWKRVLSDADFNALCGNTASAFINLGTGAPDALWLCNVSNPASIVDATGNGANATSVVGSGITGNGTDPPSFNYSLISSSPIPVPWVTM